VIVIVIGETVSSDGSVDFRVNTFEVRDKEEMVFGLIVKVRAPQISALPEV
jgi:hypothetical protein